MRHFGLRGAVYHGTLVHTMPPTVASAELSDSAFLTALADCSLPLDRFHHGDHLRLAWLELRGRPFPEALNKIRQTIRAFAAHHGKAAIYHETITTAWVALLASHHEPTFAEFLSANQHLLNAKLLERYWWPQTLYSPSARDAWLPPDRAPLPIDLAALNSLTEEPC
jgi:hypothetical protein